MKAAVIVPTRNNELTLEACLLSIRKQTHPNVEIVVVDNRSTDRTKEIASRYADKVLDQGPERSAQRNFGAWKSNSDFLLILDSDMLLSKFVLEDCANLFRRQPLIKAAVIPEESCGKGFWARCKKLERSFYPGIPWMEAARAFRRDAFREAGGYDEKNTGSEDYDLPQKIRAKYGPESIGRIGHPIFHDETGLSLAGTMKKKFYYAKTASAYKARPHNREAFARQANPWKRYTLFFSNPKRLFRNPVVGTAMLFMKTLEFAAGVFGLLAAAAETPKTDSPK